MISHSTYQALLKDKLTLTTALENNPVFQELNLISKLIESYEKQADQQKPKVEPDKNQYNREDRYNSNDEIAEAGIQHWVKTGNTPITISGLKQKLEASGIKIKGQSPGTTLGAIISQRKLLFERVDEKKGLWCMRQEFYATKKKMADQKSAA